MQNNHFITFSIDENMYNILTSFAEESNLNESTLVSTIVSSYCIEKLASAHNTKTKKQANTSGRDAPLLKKFKELQEKYKIRQVDLTNIFNISQASISRGLTGEKNVLFKTIHKYKDENSLEYDFIAKHYLDILLHSYSKYKEKIDNLQDLNDEERDRLTSLSYHKDAQPKEHQIAQYFLGFFYREHQDELDSKSITIITDFLYKEKAFLDLHGLAIQFYNDPKRGFFYLFEELTRLNERFDITLF